MVPAAAFEVGPHDIRDASESCLLLLVLSLYKIEAELCDVSVCDACVLPYEPSLYTLEVELLDVSDGNVLLYTPLLLSLHKEGAEL